MEVDLFGADWIGMMISLGILLVALLLREIRRQVRLSARLRRACSLQPIFLIRAACIRHAHRDRTLGSRLLAPKVYAT
jgi:hypothetical protein